MAQTPLTTKTFFEETGSAEGIEFNTAETFSKKNRKFKKKGTNIVEFTIFGIEFYFLENLFRLPFPGNYFGGKAPGNAMRQR